MKQTQAPSTNLSPRKPSKVSEMQMKAKKMQVIKRKRRNLVIKRKTSEVEEDNEGEKEVREEEKEARDEEKEVGEEEKEPAEKEKEPAKEGDEMEPRRNDEEAEERTTQSVREHEAHAKEILDDEEEGMQPLKMHFPSSQYQKSLKLSGKCYINTPIRNIQTILKKNEVEWFVEHPQFQHFFHIKNRKQKWMGMWLLVLRSASVAKKYELWFIVNDVPIRYSLREFRLISGLYCHEYPPNHERLGGTTFMNKYFGGKRVTYADLEKQMLAMKSKPSQDRLKMAALYFLATILVGGRKSGEGASPFPWGRYAFEHNLKDVSSFLEKCNGVVPTSWVFTSFPIPLELLAFEAIPSLRNHFRESVNGARPVDRWTKIIQKGKKQVFFEEQFGIDFAARTAQVEGPTIPAIGGGSNNAESGQTDAYSVEAPRVEALKAMEGRLMNAISDGMKEVNKKVKSLSNRLTLVENEVKSLRVSVPRMSELMSEGETDNSSDQDGSDNPSEEDGDDTPSEEDGGDTSSEEDKDGGSKNDSVLAIANQVQSEHGNGDDDMDDTAEMSAAAEKLEIEILEKTNTEKKKKKRVRKDDGKELLSSKKPKVCNNARSPIWTRGQKMEDAAQKEAAQNEAGQKEVAQKKDAKQKADEKKQTKKAAQKKAGRKNKKPKKGGKKTL
ncbi:uncharacterized protein At3g43530-like [Brassica napus]|nr:uncharacterized protein At3g43530-like [Brassica napus]